MKEMFLKNLFDSLTRFKVIINETDNNCINNIGIYNWSFKNKPNDITKQDLESLLTRKVEENRNLDYLTIHAYYNFNELSNGVSVFPNSEERLITPAIKDYTSRLFYSGKCEKVSFNCHSKWDHVLLENIDNLIWKKSLKVEMNYEQVNA